MQAKGYYDAGIGQYIHHDDRGEMGDILSDLSTAINTAVTNVTNQAQTDLNQLQNTAVSSASSSLLNSTTGQQATGLALQAGQAALVAQAQQYMPYIIMGVGGLLVAYLLFSGGRKTYRAYYPQGGSPIPFAVPAQVTAPAKTNPRRRRR